MSKSCLLLRTINIAFLLLLVTYTSQAQTYQGKVVDESGMPIGYANVTLISPLDSAIVSGTTTDLDGRFLLPNEIKSQANLLSVSFVGYQTQYLSYKSLLSSPVIQLIPISMVTNEVVITAKRPHIVVKADRMIVNVSGSILSAAANGMEMLQKTPGLMTSGRGAISVVGQGAPIIYIDDRKVYDIKEVQSLNPQNIRSIEVIDNPSAVYEADGHAVLLIHTQKNKELYYVNFGSSLTQRRKLGHEYNLDASFNLKNIYINAYSSYINQRGIFHETNTRFNNGLPYVSSYGDTKAKDETYDYRFSIEYTPNKRHQLGLQVNGSVDRAHEDIIQPTVLYDELQQDFCTYSSDYRPLDRTNLTAFYKFKMDSVGQYIKVVADYSYRKGQNNQQYKNVVEEFTAEDAVLNVNQNNNSVSNLSINANYVKPFKNAVLLETGVKYYLMTNDTQTDITGSTRLHQTYSTTENNMAGFFSLSKEWAGISIKVGLRGEYSKRKGYTNSDQTVNKNEFSLFPSFQLNYKTKNDMALGFSYTKRITRPSMSSMDPSSMLDSLTNRQGNPFLAPAYTHILRFTFTPLKSVILRFGYNRRIHPIFMSIYQNPDYLEKLYVRFENYENSNYYMISGTWNGNITKWWSATTSLHWWYNPITHTDETNHEYKNTHPMWNYTLQNTFVVMNNLSIDLGFYYNGKGSSGLLYEKQTWNLYASVRKEFPKKGVSVGLSVNDLFRTTNTNQQSILAGNNINLWDGDESYVRLSVNYKLGSSKYRYKSMSMNTTERNRM